VRRAATFVAALTLVGAATSVAAPAASAAVRQYWVAAVDVTWNQVPNGHDAIMGATYSPAETVFPTVVYRRYSRGWKHPMRNAPAGSSNRTSSPGR
jgi:manganese oxidase